MKLRIHTLWRVPVYCLVSSWFSYYVTVYIGGSIFTVQTIMEDGSIALSADPVRSAVFHGCLFAAVLFLGGFWAFRSMTKTEIAVSSAIISLVFLAITLAQLYAPGFPLELSIKLAVFQNWTGAAASFFQELIGHFQFSVLLANFAPFLFVPFGRKTIS